jgi:hypothetical protein
VHKRVETVIAASRILIRNPSEQKLGSQDLRYLLHNILDEYNTSALKRNRDYFTHSEIITLAYDELNLFTPTLPVSTLLEYYVVHLSYQPLTSDPDTDGWHAVNRIKVDQFPSESDGSSPIFAVMETALGSERAMQFRMNLTDEFVQRYRWRLDYRAFPTDTLQFDDIVPFPQEFTNLLEHKLAAEAIQLVQDNSADWVAFRQVRSPWLEMKCLKLERAFEEWLDKDITNIIINAKPFHYIGNNVQNRRRVMNLRTEPH